MSIRGSISALLLGLVFTGGHGRLDATPPRPGPAPVTLEIAALDPAAARRAIERARAALATADGSQALASLSDGLVVSRTETSGDISLLKVPHTAGAPPVPVLSFRPTFASRPLLVASSSGLVSPRLIVIDPGEGESELVIVAPSERKVIGRLLMDMVVTGAAALGRSHVVVIGRDRATRPAARIVQLETLKSFAVALPATTPANLITATPVGGTASEAEFVLRDEAGQSFLLRASADRRPGKLAPLDLAVLGAYMLGMAAIGLFCGRRISTGKEMYLGGGRVPGWAAGLSIVLTHISAISFIALPSRAFASNCTMLLFLFTPVVAAPIVIRYIMPVLRRGTYLTAYEVLGVRFGNGFRRLGSWFYCIYELGRTGVLLVVPSMLISMMTGIPVIWCILIAAAVTTLYTTIGGFEAVIWTDVVQGVVMLAALVAAPVLIFCAIGSVPEALGTAWEAGKFRLVDGDPSLGREGWLALILSLATSANSYLWHQPTVQRLLSARDERTVRSTVISAAISSPLMLSLMFGGGALLFSFYSAFPERMAVAVDSRDEVFASFVIRELPAGWGGLVIAAIFAASMSSLSGGINSITSVIAGDLMPRRNRERWVGSRAFSRWVTLACGIVGSLLALAVAAMPVRSLFDVFIEFTNLLSGSLAGVFVLALFGDRFRTLDATAGFVVSLLVVAAAKASGGFSFMLYGTLGTAACLVTALLTAQIFPRHRNSVQVLPSPGTTGHSES